MEKGQIGQTDIPKSLNTPLNLARDLRATLPINELKESHKMDPQQTDMIKQREELFNKYVECMKTNNYAVKECDYIIMLAKGDHGKA